MYNIYFNAMQTYIFTSLIVYYYIGAPFDNSYTAKPNKN